MEKQDMDNCMEALKIAIENCKYNYDSSKQDSELNALEMIYKETADKYQATLDKLGKEYKSFEQ